MLTIRKRKAPRVLFLSFLTAAAMVLGVGYALLQPTPKPVNAATPCVDQVFRYDVTRSKNCVRYIQRMLNNITWQTSSNPVRYYHANLVVDGLYGSMTTSAVKKLQTRTKITVDGVVGPQTWRKLCWPYNASYPTRAWVRNNSTHVDLRDLADCWAL